MATTTADSSATETGQASTRVRGWDPGPFGRASIVMTACGATHSVVASVADDVFTWGGGEGGYLGHNNEQDILVPARLGREQFGGGKIVFVAVRGAAHGDSGRGLYVNKSLVAVHESPAGRLFLRLTLIPLRLPLELPPPQPYLYKSTPHRNISRSHIGSRRTALGVVKLY